MPVHSVAQSNVAAVHDLPLMQDSQASALARVFGSRSAFARQSLRHLETS